jgi:hypothetical protein
MRSAGLRLAVLMWLIGAATIGATWWDSGDQATSATQLPAVLVAGGAGLGSVVVGCLLYAVHRARLRQVRAERLLAALADGRSAIAVPLQGAPQ